MSCPEAGRPPDQTLQGATDVKIITLKEAKAQGLRHYFTGVPCARGHIEIRYVNGKGCSACARIRTNQWRQDNPESQGKWHRENPDRARDTRLQRLYGISLEDFNRMLAEQDHCCAICLQPFDRRPHVDHCHPTGKVRGLLCDRCNHMVGHGRDDPAILRAGADYLDEHRK